MYQFLNGEKLLQPVREFHGYRRMKYKDEKTALQGFLQIYDSESILPLIKKISLV